MSAAFNIALPGTEPAPRYTPENHPHRGMRADRATIEHMFTIAGTVRENIERIGVELESRKP